MWSGLTIEVFIKEYQFEDLLVDDITLKKCLKLNLMVYDRSTEKDSASVWLSREHGIMKWVRTTGREEVIELTRP
jgi:hypothetical protein